MRQRNCEHRRARRLASTNFNLLTEQLLHALTQAHAMSDLCKVAGTKSRNIATLLAAKFPPLPNDFGRGNMLISFRTMAYVQANTLLSELYLTSKDELFQRATSFQESLEEELKAHYATEDISRHPDYRAELQTLLSTYYEELLGVAGASGVKAPRPLALASTPTKPPASAAPAPAAPAEEEATEAEEASAAATQAKPAGKAARWGTSGK